MFSANLRHWRPTPVDHFAISVSVIVTALLCVYLLYVGSLSDTTTLLLNTSCNLLEHGCSKGDLIDTKIADCKRSGPKANIYTCDPLINDLSLSSVVDLPDVNKHSVTCNADTERPIICGAPGTNTRCVCNKAMNLKRPKETASNQCRCQYWPEDDACENQPNFCTQFDHGGKSTPHFYICCNNCQESDTNCNGHTYQGGAATDAYCDACGRNSKSGGGRAIYTFNCLNCSKQNLYKEKCHHRWNGFPKEIPGLSPLWADCFRECCLNATMKF